MTITISRENVFYAFQPGLEPVRRVPQGQEIVIETHDCFQGQLQSKADQIDGLDWARINPASGPIYFEGVLPGDVIRFDLLDVQVAERSTMVALPGEGALGDLITEMETSILPYVNGQVIFKHKIAIPARPMIGVIGVAPAQGSVPNGTPGPHGGNMDCTLIGAGTSLYLTAGVAGALFGCGDMHAVMGDGEIVVCGAETSGSVRLKAQVTPLAGLPTPFLETPDLFVTIFSALTLDEAAAGATHHMAQFLTGFARLPLNDAGMLMSLVGDLKFCQVVDPQKTVRFEFPKRVLKEYGFEL